MIDPQQNPSDPSPDQAPTPAAPDQQTEQSPDQTGAPQPDAATSTQENMGDGAGIRGEYGNASQTNGLEGGPDSPATDTELTGS